jgi:membrane protein
MAGFSVKLVWKALKESFNGFMDDKVPKLSASLAYYTVFSIAPLLLLIIFVAGMILGREAVEGSVYEQVKGFIGNESADQVQEMIKSAALADTGVVAGIIGIVMLLVGATSMFAELQDSINEIWGLKPKSNVGFVGILKSRLLSFGIIGSLVFLLLVSLAASTIIEVLGKKLTAMLPDIAVILIAIFNYILNLVLTTLLFAVIFKVLPSARIRYKDVLPGAIATSILFLAGKFLISFYIGTSDVGSTYGAAGSLVVLLIWIYYSSIILYFGAEFTKFYAFDKGAHINPEQNAKWVRGNQPNVSAADKTEKPELKRSPEKFTRKELVPLYAPGAASPSRPKKKTGKPGMGMVLLGLAIYFIKNGKNS